MGIITLDNINKIKKEERYLIIENICNNLGLELDNIINFTLEGLRPDKKIVNKIGYVGNSQKTYNYIRSDINGQSYQIEFSEKEFEKKPVYISKDLLIYKTNSKFNKNLIKNCVVNENVDFNGTSVFLDDNKILNIASYISDKNAAGHIIKSVGSIIIQNEENTKYNLTINSLLSLMIDYYFYNISLQDLEYKIPLLYNSSANIFYMSLYNTITIFRYLLSIYEKTYIPLVSIFIINDYYKIKKMVENDKVNILGFGFENKLNITTSMIEKVFKDIENGTCFEKIPNYEYIEEI